MEQKIFSVYVDLQDEEFNIPDYLNDKQFFIHICPESIRSKRFSKRAIDKVISALERGCLLGQRGNSGRCSYETFHKDTGTDPWHENYCPYNKSLDFRAQYSFMLDGFKVLENTFTSPKAYSPINHLFDSDTLKAVRILKYEYMMDKNCHGISVYEDNRLVIIPEEKIVSTDGNPPKSTGVYVHLSDLNSVIDKIKKFELVMPGIITFIPVTPRILVLNHAKKIIEKYKRDIANLK